MQKNKLLFIGRLCETKCLFTLLHTLKLLPQTDRPVVNFVEDRILKSALLAFVTDHQLTAQVNFLGATQSTWFITRPTGIQVPSKNPIKLAEAIIQFYALSSCEVQTIKNNAYDRVRELYSAEKQASKLSSIIEQHR